MAIIMPCLYDSDDYCFYFLGFMVYFGGTCDWLDSAVKVEALLYAVNDIDSSTDTAMLHIRPTLGILCADSSGTVYQCVSTEFYKQVRLKDVSRTSWLSNKIFPADLQCFDENLVDVSRDFRLPSFGGKARLARLYNVFQVHVDGSVQAIQIDSLYYDWNARKAVFGISLLNSVGCGHRVLKAVISRQKLESCILAMTISEFSFQGPAIWQLIEAKAEQQSAAYCNFDCLFIDNMCCHRSC